MGLQAGRGLCDDVLSSVVGYGRNPGSLTQTQTDARGDVFRGLEVVEQACGAGVTMMGETLGGVANGVDTYSYREPLGVCAGKDREAWSIRERERSLLSAMRVLFLGSPLFWLDWAVSILDFVART